MLKFFTERKVVSLALVGVLAVASYSVQAADKKAHAGLASSPESSLKSSATQEPDGSIKAGRPVIRRLTSEQYANSIADIFGPNVDLGGRFEPEVRKGGLVAVGSSEATITASGLEQFDNMARKIAAQVMDPSRRAAIMNCKPAADNAADPTCTKAFLERVGLHLYRRSLTAEELTELSDVANAAAKSTRNFYEGLGRALANMLVSPPFLFRFENTEPDPANPSVVRLDAYSKAARLSFFIWNSAPDALLLQAAADGSIHTKEGYAQQVDRMMASKRLEGGVRAFFDDMLHLDEIVNANKDVNLYPEFTPAVAQDAREETLRTIVNHLVVERGDYRDLFTTRKTFLTPALGALYGVPVVQRAVIGQPDSWTPYEYTADSPRVGLLAQASFLSLHSHPGRSSATLRGKALRELFMCQKVPDPPGNVDFTVVQQADSSVLKTARQRLDAHATQPMCAGCHKITDPIGLALENFDGSGRYRTTENGEALDLNGSLNGVAFKTPGELGSVVAKTPAITQCVVKQAAAYATGLTPDRDAAEWVKYLDQGFAADGYRFTALMRRIALSKAFGEMQPRQEAPNAQAASTN